MKYIYLIRHSGPFVEINNYGDYENVPWDEYNKNMILSVKGEMKASELTTVEELKGIKNIYSSNSARAIETAKYLSGQNDTKIRLDERINERVFGINYLRELPKDFTKHSFNDKDFKIGNGESLNEMDKRFNSFIDEVLSKHDKTIIVIHGIMLLSFLQNNCDFRMNDNEIFIKYNGKDIVNVKPKNPSVYKITYNDEGKIIDIDNIFKC